MLDYLGRHHLGLLALFFALSGTSYAVATGSIDSREIRNNSIRSKDVRNNRLTSTDLRNNTVRSRDIADGGLTGADVLDGGLNGAELATGSVEGSDVRDGSLGDADLGTNSVSSDELTSAAVRSDELQNGAVRSEDLQNGAVRSEDVQNGGVRAEDLQAGLLSTDAGVRSDTFTVAAGATAEGAVACAAGERVIGGGASFATGNPDDRLTYSEPRSGNAVPGSQAAAANGWAAGMRNGGTAERTATVWATCASR